MKSMIRLATESVNFYLTITFAELVPTITRLSLLIYLRPYFDRTNIIISTYHVA